MTTGLLARALFYKNTREAIALEQQALILAGPLKDGQYKSFTYSTLVMLYSEVKDYEAARFAADSAVWYAGRTNNRVIKGYAWLRKGWLEFFDEKYDQALSSLLKSVDFLEGQEAYQYENLAYYFIAGIYWNLHDLEKYNKYIRLSWETALLSKDPDDVCRGYQAKGNGYLERYAWYC